MGKLAILGGEPITRKRFIQYPVFDQRELTALQEVLESRVWGGYHPKVKEFEGIFAEFHDSRYGVTAANGTVTLEAALLALGIGKGDEVIVPPISFVATATAVLRVGATPVFVDIDPKTFNIDPAQIREAISRRTRAMAPVHFGGQPVDMDALTEIAERHEIAIIEDCAHAHGAEWRGKKVGSFGDFGSFSFQATKNLTAGEGGILTTNSKNLEAIVRSICNQGRRDGGDWYEHVRLGTNYRITGWQAAILLTQFSRLTEQIKRRNENARILNEHLDGMGLISLPYVDRRVTCHSFYLYLIRLNLEQIPGLTKEEFVEALEAEGIPCSKGYPHPLYEQKVFSDYKHIKHDCPEAENFCEDTFWLSHETMLTEAENLEDVIMAFEKVTGMAASLKSVPI